MSIKPIKHYPSKHLKTVCNPVVDFEDEAFTTLLEDLRDTAKAHTAHGLAANQIGSDLRVFITKWDGDEEYKIFVNPTLELEGDLVPNHEGCLSFPGATLLVIRPEECTVVAQDEKGVEFTFSVDDVQSVALQHEYDHLDGKTVLDSVSRLVSRMFLKKVNKYKKRYGKVLNFNR